MNTAIAPQHDVVVVGTRCAGSAAAMLLARQGFDVVAVDRARFPSDTLSTHSIARGGVVQLSRWGLLEEVIASGAPPIRQVSFHVGDDVVRRTIKERAGVDLLVAPRRHVLDAILVGAAEAAGADVRSGITVSEVSRDAGGRVTGVVGRDADGNAVELRARLVIGADGLRSGIARSVEAPVVEERHRKGAVFYTYVADVDFEGTEFHLSERRFAGLFPTHDGEANVWLAAPAADLAHLRGHRDRSAAFLELLDHAAPALAERARDGRQTAAVRGFLGMPNQLRQPVGPGWALVGDASHFRDAITGHGITDAFRDAELLARALGPVLRGDIDEQDGMATYHDQRDRMTAELFDITCRMAEYPDVTEFVELQKQLSRRIEVEAELLDALSPISDLVPAHAA